MPEITNGKNNLPLIIAMGILTIILGRLPFGGLIFYPFIMFVTYLHEACHGLTAIITGGQIVNFQMSLDTSGVAYTAGGIRTFIISAGYLGSSICGSMLLIAAFKKGTEKLVLNSLAVFFLLFTFLFARNIVAFTMGLFFFGSMFLLGRMKHTPFLTAFLAFLAVQCCFQSFNDILTLIFLSGTGIRTDALIMSQEITGGLVPPIFFALLWGLIALGIFGGTLKLLLKNQSSDSSLL
jgi:hypothetical protein